MKLWELHFSLMKKKSVIFRPLIDTQLFVSACDSFPDKYTQSMLICPVIIFDLLSDVDSNRNYFKISAEKNITIRKSGVRLPKSRTNGELQWFFFLVFKQCHRHAIVIMWKIRKPEINEARGLFSLGVADSNKKQRCSPTKKMIRFPWNRNNLMLTARASNRQCLTAWQRSRCWWWRSSPTWTWSSARTSSPSTN